MANTGDLSAGANGGTQTSTQDPQSSTQTSSLGQSQNVQTGTATSLLNGQGGIPLQNTSVTTLGLPAASVRTAPPTVAANQHSTNPALWGFSILLFAVAIALFWATSRPSSVKSTTK